MSSCSICLGSYLDPRILPCGHSFCFPCLQKLEKLSCPLCTQEFSLADHLIPNYALVYSAAPKSRHDCRVCRHAKELWCRQCAQPICLVAEEDGWHESHEILSLTEARKYFVGKLSEKKEEIKKNLMSATRRMPAYDDSLVKELCKYYSDWLDERQKILTVHCQKESDLVRLHQEKLREQSAEMNRINVDEATLDELITLVNRATPVLDLALIRRSLGCSLLTLTNKFSRTLQEQLQKINQNALILPQGRELSLAPATLQQMEDLLADQVQLRQELDAGLSPDYSLDNTALLSLAVTHDKLASFLLLLEYGADPHTLDDNGTPLLHSILKHPHLHEDAMNYITPLCQYGAEVPTPTTIAAAGWLISATRFDKEAVITFLLALGANPDAPAPHAHQNTAREYQPAYFTSIPSGSRS